MEKFYQIFALVSLVLYWVLVAGVTIRVVLKRRAVSVSLAWLMIIYIVPVLGVVCYFLFGELNLGRKRAERAQNMFSPYGFWFNQLHDCQAHQPDLIQGELSQIHDLCSNRTGIPALCGNTLSLQTTPEGILRSVIEDIENAEQSIRMVFYIWHPGGLADSVASALIKAAKRGVTVQVLLDSAGSHRFFRSHWVDLMKRSGVDVVQALGVSPMRVFLRRLDLRQHRKIITIDDQIAYTGSMNMVDPAHFKQDAGVGQWIDVMVRVTGPTVNVLAAIHAWDWEVETGERILPSFPLCAIEPEATDPHPVQVVPSGPGMPENLIQQVLNLAISQAKHSVRITTPYFVPSENLLETLKMTAQRGVKVELIIPHRNDSIMVKWASKAFYSELLNCGIEIYEFSGGLLHTKSVVIDEHYALIGTVNLDMRSLWLNFEVTLAVDDKAFTQELYWVQQSYIDQAHKIQSAEWSERGFIHRFFERAYFLFSPLL
ncbi:cardiolipin synthase [Vibrio sp. SCSIO 43136]|uniref:cardiolipin synthase n=1 Tax=Vibrio sp. SCSIO 43136 TaxID=2819101 RepID=UPI00207613EF|nr:cardiolipin synthase [Vibrio sp. SCSIO 43136]USD66307.1 cardiolipin synthase [Vibrio sp. SCSIO 43136]